MCVHSPIWDGVSEFPWQPILTCPFLLHHFPNFKVRDSKWTSGSNLVQFRLVGTWYQVPGITLAWSSSFRWNYLTPPSSSAPSSWDPYSIAISTYALVSCQFSFFHHFSWLTTNHNPMIIIVIWIGVGRADGWDERPESLKSEIWVELPQGQPYNFSLSPSLATTLRWLWLWLSSLAPSSSFPNNTLNKCQKSHAHKATKPDFNLTNTDKYVKKSVAERDDTTKQWI